MKRSNLAKIAGAGILALNLALLPSTLPASAQTTPDSVENTTSPAAETQPVRRPIRIDNINGNWLGEIGLICLALLSREYSKPR